jgi:hypothetical protein
MTARAPLQETAGAAVFEIERFEWVAPDRIEILGVWAGVRGRRFMRPTLVLEKDGQRKRLLAMLEHKPWAADDGTDWIAAFAWEGPIVKLDAAELNVAPGLDLKLPAPRMRQGKPRRFKQRVVARDAVREAEAAAPSGGIVSEVPATAKAAAAEAKAAPAKPAAAGPVPVAEPEAPIGAEASEAPAIAPQVEALRVDLDRARSDRDEARSQLQALRAEVEQERQQREGAVADARTEERDRAATMLAEGAELRAAVERQREIAYATRDAAEHARDEAIAARDRAVGERDEAVRLRKQAERDRDNALAQRDRAVKERERAVGAREKALAERAAAHDERDEADAERKTILSLHERGLPVHEPEPRFLPKREQPRSDTEIWAPRAIAVGLLVLFALFVLHLLGGI